MATFNVCKTIQIINSLVLSLIISSEVSYLLDQSIDPVDTCGCGDIGYLTTRTVPINLSDGVGHIENVPVYRCRTKDCGEFTIPTIVAHRLDDIAEQMEMTHLTKLVFTWVNPQELSISPLTSHDPFSEVHIQAFTLQFVSREYEDARVILVIPSQAIFFKSFLEDAEYYLLRYEPESRTERVLFSFYKFYYEDPNFSYEDFLIWSTDGQLKEIGQITMDEVEDALIDEFGEST